MTTPRPTILIIDDDLTLGRSLKRLAEQSFVDHQVLWARNGVTGLDLVRRHAVQLRLIVLDINMPLMDGNLAAAQIRALAPSVPVMPFTSYTESLPALSEMGCVPAVLKHPETLRQMPELMREAMAAAVASMPDRAWIAALHQSAQAVLSFVSHGEIGASWQLTVRRPRGSSARSDGSISTAVASRPPRVRSSRPGACCRRLASANGVA